MQSARMHSMCTCMGALPCVCVCVSLGARVCVCSDEITYEQLVALMRGSPSSSNEPPVRVGPSHVPHSPDTGHNKNTNTSVSLLDVTVPEGVFLVRREFLTTSLGRVRDAAHTHTHTHTHTQAHTNTHARALARTSATACVHVADGRLVPFR